MRMRLIVVCGLPRSTIFFHISHKRHDFRKKKVIEYKMCVFASKSTIFPAANLSSSVSDAVVFMNNQVHRGYCSELG